MEKVRIPGGEGGVEYIEKCCNMVNKVVDLLQVY